VIKLAEGKWFVRERNMRTCPDACVALSLLPHGSRALTLQGLSR
jgi:hypothetical protein